MYCCARALPARTWAPDRDAALESRPRRRPGGRLLDAADLGLAHLAADVRLASEVLGLVGAEVPSPD